MDYSIEQISDSVDGVARYRVTVKDNGIGMSEEFQEHLFESFSREQSATVSKQEGANRQLHRFEGSEWRDPRIAHRNPIPCDTINRITNLFNTIVHGSAGVRILDSV